MIEQTALRLIDLIYEIGYPGLFVASFLENLIPPIPSEIIMPLGGYLAGIGRLDLLTVILVCSLGSTLGNLPYYLIGRFFSHKKMTAFVSKYGKYFLMTTKGLESIYSSFRKHDKKIVLIGRFIPGARGFIGIPAGSAKMDFFQFMIYTFVGTSIRSIFLVSLGFITGEKKDLIIRYYRDYSHIIIPVLVVIVFAVLFYGIRKILQDKNITPSI